jgi:enamine deaminase RidA (YjgF/YER057c/UK114 family)
MKERKAIVPADMRAIHDRFHYSPAVRVGDTLYLAGQVGRDKDLNVIADPEAQYVRAFENLKLVLTTAGSDLDHVVDLTSYHTSVDDLMLFIDVKNRYFVREPYPAWTVIGVSALAMPGLRVELKCIAIMPR